MNCALCNEPLVIQNGPGRPPKYCPKHHRNAARAVRRQGPTRFVGVDGEGWTDNLGNHYYSQLSVGDRSLFGTQHLDFLQIVEFLWSAYQEDPAASYVGFYLGYDFAQWFRTLPEPVAHELLAPDGVNARRSRRPHHRNPVPAPVTHLGWEFDVLGTKRFKLRAVGAKSWMYVCDTGPFFQTSFMQVINPKKWPDGSPVTEDQYRIIAEGKAKRADYATAEQWAAAEHDLVRYNVAENQALAQVMAKYEEGLTAVGVRLQRDQWYGPGQAAQAWLSKVGMSKREDLELEIPGEVFDFARRSYYGGRFEVFAHGHVPGTSFEYDINSAYPAAMAVMPDWADCTYEWGGSWDGTQLALIDVTTTGSDPILAGLPHRDRHGGILYPWRTRGVRWSFEVEAALAAGLVDTMDVHRTLVIRPGSGSVLNAEIPAIYQERLRVGKESSAGKAMKLIYNSAYGKQAQSIGSPKYSNPLSASFITARCRTEILRSVATHPGGSKSLLMIATDGIYFRTPHPSLELSETELGKWSAKELSNLTIVMPGVYYSDEGREAGAAKVKSRGIPAQAFANAMAELDVKFHLMLEDPTHAMTWPTLELPIAFRVQTPKSALNEGHWERAGRVTRDVERKLSTDPSAKRVGPAPWELAMFSMPDAPYVDAGVVRTWPYREGQCLESVPYSKDFGIVSEFEDGMQQLMLDGDSLGSWMADGLGMG